MAAKTAQVLSAGKNDLRTLRAWVKASTSPQRIVMRSRIILLAAEGKANTMIARELKVARTTVLLWRKRFLIGGTLALLEDAPGRGRKPSIPPEKIREIIEATTQKTPKEATHWSTRLMAKYSGVSKATVQRIWDANGLKPHRVKTFKLSNDPFFVEKLTDVVGLYLNPPDRALVLCVDEKTQVQALDRTQPSLPMKKGRCGTMTHDYKRNGTTSLFAALSAADGSVIGACYPRHRNEEFLKFLRKIDRETPKDLDLHLVLDNYGTHKHKKVKDWLENHPRFHLHFTPTSSSWLNLVERFFADITSRRIRRGVFSSVAELEAVIKHHICLHNENPKPIVWTKGVDDILRKVNKCRAILETHH